MIGWLSLYNFGSRYLFIVIVIVLYRYTERTIYLEDTSSELHWLPLCPLHASTQITPLSKYSLESIYLQHKTYWNHGKEQTPKHVGLNELDSMVSHDKFSCIL